jgi:PAB-dependent poly(A)-specific ribonuclease subunit 3
MSSQDYRRFQALSSLYRVSPVTSSLFNTLPEPPRQNKGTRLPTIQPTSPDKGAISQTTPANRSAFYAVAPAHTHASVIASSGSSSTTTESLSELTSHSSRDSLAITHVSGGDTTPQKQARSNRRKSSKSNARWSRGGGSSDDTRPDRTPPTSQPSDAALNAAQSPTPTYKQRQPHTANRNPAAKQGRLMATTFGSPSGDSRRGVASPRPKGRGMKSISLVYCRELTGQQKRRIHFAAMSPSTGIAGTRTVSAGHRTCRTL